MATKPTFKLTGKVAFQVDRDTPGEYVNGKWVEGVPTVVTVEGNIQPFKFHEILQLPESDRTKEWIKVYSAEELYTDQEGIVNGRQADIINWEEKKFKVMQCHHYSMGVLDHYAVRAVRIPVSAL